MVNLFWVVKDVYVLVKVLISDEVSLVVIFSGDGVIIEDYVVYLFLVIKSYMLKNCLLYILSEELSFLIEC